MLLGIIAEYNPFHLGHQYHLQQARQSLDFEGTIVVMSGHFTQRGTPTLTDKWLRAHMAILGGADLVLELPCAFSVRSAYYFALGGVLSLACCGITHLSFGIESDEVTLLAAAAHILAQESESYQETLKQQLSLGLSFAAAQSNALTQFLPQFDTTPLKQPNNLLAMSYLQVIKRFQLPITPLAIKRQGDYHNLQPEEKFASASAIRRMLLAHESEAYRYLPQTTTALLPQELIDLERFKQTILTLIRRSSPNDLRQLIEIKEGLEHKLIRAAQDSKSLDDLCLAVKSKRYPYSRINRSLCHLLLNFTNDYAAQKPYYLRVLAFNQTGARLLKKIKRYSTVPIITKSSVAMRQLPLEGQKMLQLDIRATDIYHTAYQESARNKGGWDYYRSPIVVI